MEGEQKVDLPLDGELDIKSSDMLVPVTQAKFAHNRQRWQGHVLPSSLRYEHNGWAAGWDVYDIKYNTADTEVTVGNVLYKIRRYYYNDNRAYKIAVLSSDDVEIGSFIYNEGSVIPEGVTVSGVDEYGTYTLTFNVGDKSTTCKYNILTDTLSDVDEANFAVSASMSENASLRVKAADTKDAVNVTIDRFNIPTAMYMQLDDDNEITIGQFKLYDNGEYSWSDALYSATLTRDIDDYVLSIKYEDKLMTEPKHIAADDVVDGVIKDVSVVININATGESVCMINTVRIDKVNSIEFGGSEYLTMADGKATSDNNFTYKYKEIDDTVKSVTSYKRNKFANQAKIYKAVNDNKVQVWLPAHITVVLSMNRDQEWEYGEQGYTINIFENNVDVTYKYNVWKDERGTVNINASDIAILKGIAAEGMSARSAGTLATPWIDIEAERLTTFVNTIDTARYSSNTSSSGTTVTYYGVRNAAPEEDYATVRVAQNVDDYGAADVITIFDCDREKINDVQFSYIRKDDTDGSFDNFKLIMDMSVYVPVEVELVAVGDEFFASGTTTPGTLNSKDINLYSFNISGITNEIKNNYILDIISNCVCDIRPVSATDVYFYKSVGINSADNLSFLPGPYNVFKPAAEGEPVTGINVDVVNIPSNVTNIQTEDVGDYVKGYNLLNIGLRVNSVGVRYASAFASQFEVSPSMYESELSKEILPDVMSVFTFNVSEPTRIESINDSYTQDVTVSITGIAVSDVYKITVGSDGLHTPDITFNFVYNGYRFNVKYSPRTFNTLNVSIGGVVTATASYTIEPTALPYVSNGDVTHADQSTVTYTVDGKSYIYNYIARAVRYGSVTIKNVVVLPTDDYYAVALNYSYMTTEEYSVILKGPTLFNKIAADTYVLDRVHLTNDIVIDMNEVVRKESATAVVTATDIRDEDITEKDIQKINSNDVFQIVKQMWDTTTEVESFWWLNSDAILVLDKTNFTVLRKTDSVDDWSGDKWVKEKEIAKISYIDSDTIKYGCTSAYKATALFYTMKVVSNNKISLDLYDMEAGVAVLSTTLLVKTVPLGEDLLSDSSLDTMCTYTDITAQQLLASAKISATVRGNNIIFGVHYDNNFNQWTFIFDPTDGDVRRVQGYGFVGTDGSLTGGEIPYKYFSQVDGNYGFSGRVEDIKALNKSGTDSEYVNSLAQLTSANERVVGTDDQQWYISNNIDSIVSHITCDDLGMLTVHPLYINNNYTTVYASGSFAAQVLGDSQGITEDRLYKLLGVTTGNVSFENIFNNVNNTRSADYSGNSSKPTTVQDVIAQLRDNESGDWGSKDAGKKLRSKLVGRSIASFSDFSIFSFAPVLSCINYVQQTIGQYAYVHYNTSDVIQQRDIIAEADSAMSGESALVYDSQQEVLKDARSKKDNYVSSVSSDELAFDTQVVRQAQSCDTSWPSAFVLLLTIAMNALDKVASKLQVNSASNQMSMAGQGTSTQLYSQAMNSLSLSDLQAQQLIPTQISEVPAIKTLDMFYSTSDAQKVYAGPGFVNHNFVAQCTAQSVTSLQLELNQQKIQWVIKIMTEAAQLALAMFLRRAAEAVDSLSGLFSTHYVVGAFVAAVAGGFKVAAGIAESKLSMMDSILNALGGNSAQVTTTATLSKHTYDVEGKHKYGNSSKAFMWPCFGCANNGTYIDEYVDAVAQNKKWYLHTPTSKGSDVRILKQAEPNTDVSNIAPFVTARPDGSLIRKFEGNVNYYISMCKGNTYTRNTPKDMAYIIGAESFLSKDSFKNDTIGEDAPVFSAPLTQDYMLSEQWELGATATAGEIAWLSVRDTKIMDGAPSNIVISDDFCGVASSYTAIEVKRGITKKYMRPVTVTPTALALNCTEMNCVYDEKVYHAFDGYGSRVVSWTGAPGMNKEKYTLLYTFLINDRFKRSNKIAPNQLLGNFSADPVVDMPVVGDDRLHIQAMQPSDNKGIFAGVPGEDKDVQRYALPVHTEYVNTLPAAVKTLSTYTLAVVEGITSLCTDIRNTQTEYKVPVSVDFTIGTNIYRVTSEYICSVVNKNGVVVTENLVPILGLSFLGASPYEAYFYSQATRMYYIYSGGTEIRAIDTVERFRDIKKGYWDFVNQEVVMPCVATFDRLDDSVHDDADETDNIIIPVIKAGAYKGEVQPPVTTIFNTDSWFKTYSLPSGVVYQGPNRCIINRFVWSDYMRKSLLSNRGLWKKVPREDYHPFRKYPSNFINVEQELAKGVKGWTHNPFLLVTSPLGINEETDCKFEWEITFAWPVEMDQIYDKDNYACVNVVAETMEPGGKVYGRPVHIYLTKELFTRTGNYGYYSFRYQSNNGAGNRERLHIWADSYIAVSSVQCAYKPVTTRRTEILTQQVDVKGLKEM